MMALYDRNMLKINLEAEMTWRVTCVECAAFQFFLLSGALLDNPPVVQLLKDVSTFPAPSTPQRFNTTLRKAGHWFLF
jgi:hypothetical protein